MLKQVCLLALFLVLFCSLYYTKSIKHNSFICRWYLFSFYDLKYWRSSEYHLSRSEREISKWSKQWPVTFNPDTTEALYFVNCQPPLLEFNNTVLSTTFDHKHLGVALSGDCKWHTHINNMCSSSSKSQGTLRKLKFTIKRNTLNQIYIYFVRPILEYSSVVWDNCSKYEKDPLERMQLEAARIVTGTSRSISTIQLYNEIGWLTLEDIHDQIGSGVYCLFGGLWNAIPRRLYVQSFTTYRMQKGAQRKLQQTPLTSHL